MPHRRGFLAKSPTLVVTKIEGRIDNVVEIGAEHRPFVNRWVNLYSFVRTAGHSDTSIPLA